jgi:hypothetical protein
MHSNTPYKPPTSNEYKETEAKWAILMALSDAQWHRNMDLIRGTKLSSRTLSKHLDIWTKGQFVEKKSDIINGKHAVLFKAKPDFVTYIKTKMLEAKEISTMEPALSRTKDPLRILDMFHFRSQVYFLDLLTYIQQHKNITHEEIYLRADYFLWSIYKESTLRLIEASRKITDQIDITQLLVNQAKRQRKDPKKVLKLYEEIMEFKKFLQKSLQNQES